MMWAVAAISILGNILVIRKSRWGFACWEFMFLGTLAGCLAVLMYAEFWRGNFEIICAVYLGLLACNWRKA